MTNPIPLSKSRIVNGIQCPKRLYLEVHHRELATPTTKSQQTIFDQGHQVGFEAQKLYPGGILIDADYRDTDLGFKETLLALTKNPDTLFEATVVYEGVSARADIFKKTPSGAWEIIEVKSTGSVKDYHSDDAAVQLWVFRGYGLQVEKISIMHINNQYLIPEKDQLFTKVDVTHEVELRLKDIPKIVHDLREILKSENSPVIDIGPQCSSPHRCPFIAHCWQHVPSPSLFDLPGLNKKDVWEFYKKGTLKIDHPDLKNLTGIAARAIAVHKTKMPFIDQKEIQNEIQKWNFPLSFLDFETVGLAIPQIPFTRPFQQVPFQFSLHIQNQKNAKLEHREFLHTQRSDPREALALALLDSIPKEGNIVAYHMSTEKGVIEDLAEYMAATIPDKACELKTLLDRFVDPLPLFRRAVYDEKFLGSFSIKSVAPALLGEKLSYENLVVAEGQAAQIAYSELIHKDTPEARKKELETELLRYCKQDTFALAELVHWLWKVAGSTP